MFYMMGQSMESAVGELTPHGSCVLEASAISKLHAWSCGGFGELVHEAPKGPTPGTKKSRAAAAAAARAPALCSLQLSAVETFYLAVDARPCRLIVFCSKNHAAAAPCVDGEPQRTPVQPRAVGPDGSVGAGKVALTTSQLWTAYCTADALFPILYAAYRELRAAGWRIRDGVKFGADFALYHPSCSPTAHATHSVLVVSPTSHARDWLWLQGYVRLCQQVSKELLICSVAERGVVDGAVNDAGTNLSTKRRREDGRPDGEPALVGPGCLDALEVCTMHVSVCGLGREHGLLSDGNARAST